MIHAEIRGDGNAQKTRRCALHRGNQSVGFTGIVEDTAGAIIIGQSNLCWAYAARRAVEQPGTQTRL